MYGLRGLGDLNCPGDPGCPGYVAPGSADYQTTLLQEILANQTAGMAVSTVAPSTASTLTAWLNTNATSVAIGAAILFGLVLFSKAGR